MRETETPSPVDAAGTRRDAAAAKRIILIYSAFASLWILVSDNVVSLLFSDPVVVNHISIAKGWLFVAVTALLLYGLIRGMQGQAQKISHRELAAQKERTSIQRLLDNIVESSSDAIFAKDRDGRYLLFNRETARVLGQAPESALGKDDRVLLPDQADMIRANDLHVMAEDRIVTFEETVNTATGTRTFLATKGPLRDETGNVIGIFGISRDITDRKQVETRLFNSELRMRALIQAIPDLVWLKDTRGIYLLCNARFEQFFGASESAIVEKTDFDFVDQALAQTFHANDLRAMEKGGPSQNHEWVTFASDGHRELLETTKTPVHDAQGAVIGILGIGHDITERKQNEIALMESESRFREIFNSVSDAIIIHDAQTGRILDVNHSMCELFGLSHEQALACGPGDLSLNTAPYTDTEAIQWIQRARIDGPQTFDWLSRTRDGRVFWADIALKFAFIGSHERVLAVVRDVSARKKAEAELQLAASVFTHAREGIIITDAKGTIVDVNQAFSRITGYSREEAIQNNPRFLNAGRQDAAFYDAMWRALTALGHWSGEIWNRRKNGEVYAEILTISAVQDAHGRTQQYVGLFTDITTIKEHQSQLEHIANFDTLTGLPNRLLLTDRLRQAMAQAQRRSQHLAVAYLDIDGFKKVNDRHGHEVGDKFLIALAHAMKNTLREGDTLARIGGDEFVAVLLDLDNVESAVPMLTRLLHAAAAPVPLNGLQLQCSASLGVTFYALEHEIEADQLLRQADQAMYQAKLAGKNRFHVFDAQQDSNIRDHHESIERIRIALKNHEFVLHYQPKVNMHNGTVIGAEALIRWQHPEKGLLAPAVFLPVIEDHPLAVEVGEWVIETALAQMEIWRSARLDLPVSVNIGARQLQQSDFVARLRTILAKHPTVAPTRLQLEVLETSAIADMTQVSHVIEACATIGVHFVLDDFGTGYSSLTYLKRLHVTQLKIDQSFVRGMLDDQDDLAILEGVIGLAAAFKHEVIAEGVETVAHGTALLRLGCQLAQGFGIARPMPAQHMPAWVATWRPDPAWRLAARPHLGPP